MGYKSNLVNLVRAISFNLQVSITMLGNTMILGVPNFVTLFEASVIVRPYHLDESI